MGMVTIPIPLREQWKKLHGNGTEHALKQSVKPFYRIAIILTLRSAPSGFNALNCVVKLRS